MPDPPPERIAALRRIARTVARRMAGSYGDRVRYQTGLDAEDLESAAMEALLRALPRHDGRYSDAYYWRVARSGVIDALRQSDPLGRTESERRRRAGESTTVTDPLDTLAAAVLFDRADADASARAREGRRDAARMVREAIGDLEPDDRALLLRIYRDDVLPEHLARELGRSPAYVGRLHHRALRRLEHALVARFGREALQEEG